MYPFIKKISAEQPVLITGTTASGKSSLAFDIAAQQGGIIINADALQVFSCWRVLSDRPPLQCTQRVPHYLYGYVPMHAKTSVGQWLVDLKRVLWATRNQRPIIIGGTGMYMSVLETGLSPIPDIPQSVKAAAQQRLHDNGLDALVYDLQQRDPKTAHALDCNNPARVLRAWQVLTATGCGLWDWQRIGDKPLYPIGTGYKIVLSAERAVSRRKISQRFDRMIDNGALDEVVAVYPYWNPNYTCAHALGAKQFIAYLDGKISLTEAIERGKTATYQYAKRQRTWFAHRMQHWTMVDNAMLT